MMTVLAPCLLPFMLHAVPSRQADDYLRAVPHSAAFVAWISDVPGLLDDAEGNSWSQFLDRECLEGGWGSLFTDRDGDEDPALLEVLETVEAVALYLWDFDEPGRGFGVVAQLEERSEKLAEHAIENFFEEVEISEAIEVDDLSVHLLSEDGERFVAVYTWQEVFVAQEGPAREDLIESVRDTVAALEDPDVRTIDSNQNFRSARGEGTGGQLEAFVNLAALLEAAPPAELDSPVFDDVLEDLRYVYLTGWLGDGQELEFELIFDHGTDNLLADFLELMEPASGDLLHLVPADSLLVSSSGIDIDAGIDLAMELLAEFGSMTPEAAEAAIDAFAEQTGVHPLDDLLRGLTGDLAVFERGELTSDEEVLTEAILLGLHDADEFLEGMEGILSATGMDGAMETDEYGGADVYILSAESGEEIFGAIAEGVLAICGNRSDIDHVIDAANSQDGSSIFNSEVFSEGLAQVESVAAFRLQDIPASVSMVAALLREAGELEDSELLDGMMDQFDDPDVISSYFSGLFAYTMDSDDGITTLRFETL